MKIYRCLLVYLWGIWGVVGNVYGQSERIVFTPQWTPQSQFAGYYVAQAKGFYQEEGLEVVFDHPSASSSALNRLEEGRKQPYHRFTAHTGHQVDRRWSTSGKYSADFAA